MADSLQHVVENTLDFQIIRFFPWIAEENSTETHNRTDNRSTILQHLFCILRTRRLMPAEAVGIEAFERTVIRRQRLLIQIDHGDQKISRQMPAGEKKLFHHEWTIRELLIILLFPMLQINL